MAFDLTSIATPQPLDPNQPQAAPPPGPQGGFALDSARGAKPEADKQLTTREEISGFLAQVASYLQVAPAELLDLPPALVNLVVESLGGDKVMPANWAERIKNRPDVDLGQDPNDPWLLNAGKQVAETALNAPGRRYVEEDSLTDEAAQATTTALSFGMGSTPRAVEAGSNVLKEVGLDVAGLGSATGNAARTAGQAMVPELAAANTAGLPAVIDKGKEVARDARDVTGRTLRPSRYNERERAAGDLVRGGGDVSTVGVKRGPDGTIETDFAARKAMKQDFDPAVLAAVKDSTPKGKEQMLRMVDEFKQSQSNKRRQVRHRGADIAGESIDNRVQIIQQANKNAGSQIDRVADTQLRGQPFDAQQVIQDFDANLARLGINRRVDPETGVSKLDYTDSALDELPGFQRTLNSIVKRIYSTKPYDAYDAHMIKRFLDEQVTYGKNARGLGGQTERIVKDLRKSIDAQLDRTYPEYDLVNTQYSETINALDDLQSIAGKNDLASENNARAMGTLARRITSNAASRSRLLESVDNIDELARKYNNGQFDLDDDLDGQIIFINELERRFGSEAMTSFMGQIDSAVVRAGMTGDTTEVSVGAVTKMLQKLRRVSDENAIEAIEELLKQTEAP